MTSLTVKPETDEATFPWTELTPADFQSDVKVEGNAISGNLQFIKGGLAPSGYLSGDGYFIALTLADNDFTDLESVKIGFTHSQESGLVELIDDPDKNFVGKVTDPTTQRFRIIQTDKNGKTKQQDFDLSGLILSGEG